MEKNFYRKILIVSILLLTSISATRMDRDFEFSRNLDIFHSVVRELDLFYADEIDPTASISTAINAMLANLDPYTVYIPESRIEDLKLMTTGEYGGVGALIGQINGSVIITDPYEGTPAQKSGLRAGDIITKVDGRSVIGKSSSEISLLMKGQVGTSVSLSVKRPYAEEEITVVMKRDNIKFPNVPYYNRTGRSAYIRLSGFTEGAGLEVRKAFTEMKEQGIDNLILDLRGNPGGLLIEAVEVMNLFVPRNQEIVSTKGKNKQWESAYSTRHDPVDTLIPVAVLVNSGSASAAEIIAGAMQDLDRGIVLGTRTFGKGLVQTTRDLSYNAKLKLTTGKYYIPSGRCIQALDYANRRADGSVGKIPDSLISEFRTKNNRKVYDGGGVQPDIGVDPAILSKLASNLIYRYKIFDFATRYQNINTTIPDLQVFKVGDSLYNEFKEFVIHSDFEYQSASQQVLKDLISKSKAEKYYDDASELFAQLDQSLEPDLNKDLALFKDEITELLEEEILSRYYFDKGRIQHMLRNDPAVEKATSLLIDEVARKRILNIQ